MHFQQLIAVVGRGSEAHLLSDSLLDVIERIDRLRQVYITVKARRLELFKLVRGLPHHMGDTSSDFQTGRAIRYHDIFCREIH